MHLRISCVVLVLLCLCIVRGQPAGAAAQDAQAFDQGITAFRARDYRAALRSFLEAQQAGLDTPGLHYNLGATYYRLQRYPEAQREFEGLARNPEWFPIAHYNLGLIAQRMERPDQARGHFEQALRMTADRNLRTLAATALARLEQAPLQRTGAVASLAGGYDSNATLSPDAATAGTSHQGDAFLEGLAAASHRFSGTAAGGLYAHGGLIVRKYRDLRQFDLTGVRLGLSRESDSDRSRTSLGGYFDTAYVGGDLFQRAAVADLQARGRLDSGGDLRGRYQLQRVEGGAGFEYLDGWQHQLSAEAGFPFSSALMRAGYQLELNRRRDLEQGADFLSYSPTRHSLFAAATLPNLGGWWTELRGEYRLSRYKDPYRLNGGTVEILREDDRYGVAVRAYRRLAGPWRAFVDYSYYRNQSTVDTYDYGRQQLLAGIEVTLEK
jgi:tetratricopeptide (TPR) repeat protein